MFSHSGLDGPIMPGEPKNRQQFSNSELAGLRINWEKGGQAWFFGCRTSTFAQNFANAQGVTAWGYAQYAYFSNQEKKMVVDTGGDKPVYLIAADYGDANGTAAAIRYSTGYGRVYELELKNPKVRKY